MIAHQLEVLRYVGTLAREELFELLVERAKTQAKEGRVQSGYSYDVPGQAQGRAASLRVIGDKSAGHTTRTLREEPDALDRLERAVGVPLRLVNVIRNPFDSAARRSLGRTIDGATPGKTLTQAIREVGDLMETAFGLVRDGPHPAITVRHEDVVADTRRELRRLCEFLGVAASDDYLDACAAIVFDSPRLTRDRVEWRPAERAAVEELIARHDMLHGYSWESER